MDLVVALLAVFRFIGPTGMANAFGNSSGVYAIFRPPPTHNAPPIFIRKAIVNSRL